ISKLSLKWQRFNNYATEQSMAEVVVWQMRHFLFSEKSYLTQLPGIISKSNVRWGNHFINSKRDGI
ncbi:MAG: hypothetical protein AABY26_06745, partial [Nanoarchaeota archaeon]